MSSRLGATLTATFAVPSRNDKADVSRQAQHSQIFKACQLSNFTVGMEKCSTLSGSRLLWCPRRPGIGQPTQRENRPGLGRRLL